ncbi:MAG: hypothetical protein AB1634_19140 [Thermodesulfobacteriota bacterium]
MAALLQFKRSADLRHPLLDQCFLDASTVDVLALNYDGEGAALCRCDGTLAAVSRDRIKAVIFGLPSPALADFMAMIYDPTASGEELPLYLESLARQLLEQNDVDLQNEAKRLRKELLAAEDPTCRYFQEAKRR